MLCSHYGNGLKCVFVFILPTNGATMCVSSKRLKKMT